MCSSDLHRSAGDLKEVLKEKLAKLLVPEVVDVEVKDLKKELGVDVEEAPTDAQPDPVDVELDALAAERRLQRSESAEKVLEKTQYDASNGEEMPEADVKNPEENEHEGENPQ